MKAIRYITLIMSFYWITAYAADIGSDTAVTRFNNVVTVNNGDRIAGFAALYGGFNLFDANTVGTFDSFFPVSGEYSLAGGTLILNQDLIFHDILSVGFFGNIIGNNHVIQFPSISRIPTSGGASYRCSPYFVSQISIGTADAETLSWNSTEQYLATASDDGIVRVYLFSSNVLSLAASIATGGVAIDGVGQVAFHPTKQILALARELGTAQVWTFSFNGVALSTISSVVLAGDGRACAWHPSGDYLAVGCLDTAGEVRIYPVDSAGVINAAGVVTYNVTPDQTIQYESIAWNKDGTYLAVGFLTGTPELIVLEVNTSPLSIVGINASATIGKNIGGLDWGKGLDYIAVGLQGTTGDNVQVYSHNDGGGGVGAGTLTFLAGSSDIGRTTEGVSWEAAGECFSASSDELAGTAYFNTYNFQPIANTLTLISNIVFTGLAAGDDFEATRWGPLGGFAAVSGDDNIIRVYALPVGQCYYYSNVTLKQGSDTTYADICLTFTGQCVWDGKGCIVEFESTATVLVATQSSLMFRDMTLIGVEGTNIKLLDSTSTVTFNNVNILLKSDYNFNLGSAVFMNDVTISRLIDSSTSFILSSTIAAHILTDSRLTFDQGTIFRYAPANSSRSNLVLDSSTSQLVFNSSTLSTSSIGIQLTKGVLEFDGLCTILNEGSSTNSSVEFGDGTLANNLTLRWLPACFINVSQGFLRYNNI